MDVSHKDEDVGKRKEKGVDDDCLHRKLKICKRVTVKYTLADSRRCTCTIFTSVAGINSIDCVERRNASKQQALSLSR